jgi:capsule assembly protein Wzi
MALLSLVPVNGALAQSMAGRNAQDVVLPSGSDSFFFLKPVSRITLEGFSYSGSSFKEYCLENAEGRCLAKKFQLFTDIEGYGEVGRSFILYYKTEANGDGELRIKKAFGKLRTGILSWEAGKDTVRMGQGYHGSLLLSDNAEGFLLARVRTEEPFRLPWLFSSLGEFKYDLFRGWSNNSSLLGQRLGWRPARLLELGANQVVYIPTGKHFAEVLDYPHLFVSSNDNSGSGKKNLFDNDQKASIDMALDLLFLEKVSPFAKGRLYAEYGGDDSNALWQKEDRNNGRIFKFLGIAWMTGLFLTTGDVDLRIEYSQNYPSYQTGHDTTHVPWYSALNTRDGVVMGHHMGNNADDFFFEVAARRRSFAAAVNFDLERHGIPDPASSATNPPEYRYQYGFKPSYRFKTFTLFADLVYNRYRNVNYSVDALSFDIHPGTRREDYIAGLGVELPL